MPLDPAFRDGNLRHKTPWRELAKRKRLLEASIFHMESTHSVSQVAMALGEHDVM